MFSRLIRAPVWVRVKKARGMLWMWRKTFDRMSKINPSPITAEMRRSVRDSTASTSAKPPAKHAKPMTRSASCCCDAVVDQGPQDERVDGADAGVEDDHRQERRPGSSCKERRRSSSAVPCPS